MATEDSMNKLGRLTSTFEMGTKEQRKSGKEVLGSGEGVQIV